MKLDCDKYDQSNEVNVNKPDKGRTNFSGADSVIQDFDWTTDFLTIFSRISFAAPISSPVHLPVVVSTATILKPLASHNPIKARKTGHTKAPSFSTVSEIVLTPNKEWNIVTWVLVFFFVSFFLLLYLQWTQHKVEMGNCCEGRRWVRRRNYKKKVNLLQVTS